jgi:hypothetical protein
MKNTMLVDLPLFTYRVEYGREGGRIVVTPVDMAGSTEVERGEWILINKTTVTVEVPAVATKDDAIKVNTELFRGEL